MNQSCKRNRFAWLAQLSKIVCIHELDWFVWFGYDLRLGIHAYLCTKNSKAGSIPALMKLNVIKLVDLLNPAVMRYQRMH